MTLVLAWDNHNRIVQADMAHAYDDGHTGREPGQKSVVEWRFGPSATGPWGAPVINVVEDPRTASYDPPGDGWAHITQYTTRDGQTSWQAHRGVVFVVGGVPVEPLPYVDELDAPYTDENDEPYEGF